MMKTNTLTFITAFAFAVLAGCSKKGDNGKGSDIGGSGEESSPKVTRYVPPKGALNSMRGPNSEVDFRSGIYYKKGAQAPYSGILYGLYENGKARYQLTVKNGKPDGVSVEWDETGQKRQESHYVEGVLNGPIRTWHKNGQKASEGGYKDGKPDGRFEGWHENGKKSGEGNFKDGESSDRKFWNKKGEPVDTYEESQK